MREGPRGPSGLRPRASGLRALRSEAGTAVRAVQRGAAVRGAAARGDRSWQWQPR